MGTTSNPFGTRCMDRLCLLDESLPKKNTISEALVQDKLGQASDAVMFESHLDDI